MDDADPHQDEPQLVVRKSNKNFVEFFKKLNLFYTQTASLMCSCRLTISLMSMAALFGALLMTMNLGIIIIIITIFTPFFRIYNETIFQEWPLSVSTSQLIRIAATTTRNLLESKARALIQRLVFTIY